MIRIFCFFIAMMTLLITAECQEKPKQQFVFSDCYIIDSTKGKQVSYEKIGDVFLFDLFDLNDSISVKCFHGPLTLSKAEEIKYIESIGETHAEIWLNNASSVKRKSLKIKEKWLYLVEIKLAIENVTMQIISFKERQYFFEIIHFFSPNSSANEYIINKLKSGGCL